jgi:hypothetical protein
MYIYVDLLCYVLPISCCHANSGSGPEASVSVEWNCLQRIYEYYRPQYFHTPRKD